MRRGDTEVASPGGDNVVGNYYDKYGTKNPVARMLMRGFLSTVRELYAGTRALTVLEVGCGEGHLAQTLFESGARPQRFVASDLDLGRVRPDIDPAIEVVQASAYDLPFPDRSFELVLCCEVLEHLDDPAAALAEVSRVASSRVLLSTPREPLWRALNMMRGRYLRALGNTPGHLQHFSRQGLVRLAGSRLRVIEVRSPLPWTVVLGEPLAKS